MIVTRTTAKSSKAHLLLRCLSWLVMTKASLHKYDMKQHPVRMESRRYPHSSRLTKIVHHLPSKIAAMLRTYPSATSNTDYHTSALLLWNRLWL